MTLQPSFIEITFLRSETSHNHIVHQTTFAGVPKCHEHSYPHIVCEALGTWMLISNMWPSLQHPYVSYMSQMLQLEHPQWDL